MANPSERNLMNAPGATHKSLKIVWTINSIFPEPAKELGKPIGEKGHWLYTLFDSIRKDIGQQCSFHIIHFAYGIRKFTRIEKKGATYYLLPVRKYAYLDNYRKEQILLKEVVLDINPDLIHVHGTEDAYGLITKHVTCPVLISLQGVRNEIIRYLFSDVSRKKYFRLMIRYHNLDMFKNLIAWKIKTRQEQEIIGINRYFIGRTRFDHASLMAINPEAEYVMGDDHRIIREAFLENEWKIGNANKYLIHSTLSESTFKGVFLLINAMEIVKRSYPSIKVAIAGTFKGPIAKEAFRTIARKGMKDNFHFLGRCNPEQLIASMKNARMFVHPSYIDNSPNSVQEAQVFGMPVIAAYTGGIPSLIDDNRTGLFFPRGDTSYLAAQIVRLIENDQLASKLGEQAKQYRATRNNPETLSSKYQDLYKKFLYGNT